MCVLCEVKFLATSFLQRAPPTMPRYVRGPQVACLALINSQPSPPLIIIILLLTILTPIIIILSIINPLNQGL